MFALFCTCLYDLIINVVQKRSLSQDDENDVKRRCVRCEERERWMGYLDEPFGDTGGLMNLEVIHFSLKT